MRATPSRRSHEPRLTTRLEQLLKEQGRLDPANDLSLRTPPVEPTANGRSARRRRAGVSRPGSSASGSRPSRPAARRRAAGGWCAGRISIPSGRRKFAFDDGKKSRCHADPLRLRLREGAPAGHRLALGGARRQRACREPMWVEEKGTSADPADTRVVCGCGTAALAAGGVPAGPARQVPRRAALAARPRSRRLRREARSC